MSRSSCPAASLTPGRNWTLDEARHESWLDGRQTPKRGGIDGPRRVRCVGVEIRVGLRRDGCAVHGLVQVRMNGGGGRCRSGDGDGVWWRLFLKGERERFAEKSLRGEGWRLCAAPAVSRRVFVSGRRCLDRGKREPAITSTFLLALLLLFWAGARERALVCWRV